MDKKNNQPNQDNNQPKMPKFNLNWIYGLIIVGLTIFFLTGTGNKLGSGSASKETSMANFKQYINKGWADEVVVNTELKTLKMYVKPAHIRDVFHRDAKQLGENPYVTVGIGSVDNIDTYLSQAQEQHKITSYTFESRKGNELINIFVNFAPFIFFFIIGYFLMRRIGGGAGGGAGVFNVGKSKAQMYEKGNDLGVTFKDVAGQAGAKQEIQEIVEFLKNPSRYTELGGKIPKGALLVGPPGTGKTLLAKAVAGEAGVPFFSMSGSDFVEMFVGVGASRVRDLFRQAKEKSPCIIFIDEIDAVGRARSKNPSTGGNDERENTLNALLTEMDGFGTNSGVIILAATNRVDMLDSALLRAGRFDRQISVELPDLHERKEIFQVHLRNESALIAARHNKKQVGKQDFLDAVDRIIGGLEKKTKVMTANEKRTIALHEAGHATISWFCEHANPLVKVSIVPRGQALGAAWYLPEERQITTKEQMLDEMCALFGGRAAEELCTGHISTGAMNDLERATKSAYGMVAYAGMSDTLPNVCFYNNQEYQFQRPYSETTAKLIDEEVLRMLNEQYNRAKQILTEHKEGHARLAELLITKEVIFAEDVEEIFGKRPWRSRTQEIIEANEKANELTLENMPEEVRKAEEEHQRMKNEQSQEAE